MMIRTKVFEVFNHCPSPASLQANGCQNNVQANFLCNQIKAKVQKKGLQNEIKLDKNKAHCIVSFTSMKLCKQENQKFFEYLFFLTGEDHNLGGPLAILQKLCIPVRHAQ